MPAKLSGFATMYDLETGSVEFPFVLF